MYCRQCGFLNRDSAHTCVRCGDPMRERPHTSVDSNLALAIIVTVLCCLPLGIVGIVHAAQVHDKIVAGDIAGAEESARKARFWSLWGVKLALLLYGGYALLMFGFLLVGG